MTDDEKAAAREAAKTLLAVSDALAPLASIFESMAEALIELSEGRDVSPDLLARLDGVLPLIDSEQIWTAVRAARNLLAAQRPTEQVIELHGRIQSTSSMRADLLQEEKERVLRRLLLQYQQILGQWAYAPVVFKEGD